MSELKEHSKGRYFPNQRGGVPTLKMHHPGSLEREDLIPGRRYRLEFNESLVHVTITDTLVSINYVGDCVSVLTFEHCVFHRIGVDAAAIYEVV
jgi:hypothetical protein